MDQPRNPGKGIRWKRLLWAQLKAKIHRTVSQGGGGMTQELPASQQQQTKDDILEKIAGSSSKRQDPPVNAVVRGIETQGAWAGASLLANLRIDGSVEIKREDFFKSGLNSLPFHI